MKKTGDVWIWAVPNEYAGERDWHYTLTNHGEMETEGWVLVEKRTIEFDTPDEKFLTAKTVEVMREALKKMKADNYVREQRMEERINSLLAIDYKPEAAESVQ